LVSRRQRILTRSSAAERAEIDPLAVVAEEGRLRLADRRARGDGGVLVHARAAARVDLHGVGAEYGARARDVVPGAVLTAILLSALAARRAGREADAVVRARLRGDHGAGLARRLGGFPFAVVALVLHVGLTRLRALRKHRALVEAGFGSGGRAGGGGE